jgi:hypothetical protein
MTNHIASLLGGFETGGRLIVHTHYIPAGAPGHPRDGELQRAVCGQYALVSEKHSLDPTCPKCQTVLQESDIHEGYISEHDERVEEDEPLPRRWL